MKALVCEMCGSQDIIKDGDYFVCQSCGTKYTVEAARKMMVEGTVEVQGTVKVDNKGNIESYLQNARRAKEKEDWEEVEKYYNLVEQYQPDNIEAIFYSAYGKAKNSLLDDNFPKRQQAFNVLIKCVSILDDNYDASKSEINKPIIIGITKDVIALICSRFVYKETRNGNGLIVDTDRLPTVGLFYNLILAYIETLRNMISKDNQIYLHECLIRIYRDAAATGLFKKHINEGFMQKELAEYEEIKKLDSSYKIPDELTARITGSMTKSNGLMKKLGIAAIVLGVILLFVLGRFNPYAYFKWLIKCFIYHKTFIYTLFMSSPLLLIIAGVVLIIKGKKKDAEATAAADAIAEKLKK